MASGATAVMLVVAFAWFGSHLGPSVDPPHRDIAGLMTLDEARAFQAYPVYWLGEDVGDAEFFAVRQERREGLAAPDGRLLLPGADRVSVAYFGCVRGERAYSRRCGVHLQVSTSPACGSNVNFRPDDEFPYVADGRRVRVAAGDVVVTITGYDRGGGVSPEDLVAELEPLQEEDTVASASPLDRCAGISSTVRPIGPGDRLSTYFGPRSGETEAALEELMALGQPPVLWFGSLYEGFELNSVSYFRRGPTPLDDAVALRYGDCGGARAASPTCASVATLRITRLTRHAGAKPPCAELPAGAVYKLGRGRVRLWTDELDIVIEDEAIVDDATATAVIERLVPLTDAARAVYALPAPWRDPCARPPALP